MSDESAAAWGLPGVLGFFDHARTTTKQVYASEWFFLKDCLREGMSVLDVGCAQGGFASVLAENLTDFSYTGIDINADMVARAQARHPNQTFHQILEHSDWAVLDGQRYDLVLVLGILHLHSGWRDTIARGWTHTAGTLLLDLRETAGPTIEDKARSYFRMDFGGGDEHHSEMRLPYILVNAAAALATVQTICKEARGISHFGYLHPVSGSAVTPVDQAMANVWRIQR